MSLALSRVTVRYGMQTVIAGADLDVQPCESVALTGPSGSGKSTLLAVLGGLRAPSSGTVSLDGLPCQPGSLRRAAISWVFQTTNAVGRRSAVDNVAMALLTRGADHRHARQRALLSLARVGLAHRADHLACTLSGGELQRLCIARALVTVPRFVLADEPTGQLDRQMSGQVVETLVVARPAHVGVVVATHDHEVAAACDRHVAVVDGGLEVVR